MGQQMSLLPGPGDLPTAGSLIKGQVPKKIGRRWPLCRSPLVQVLCLASCLDGGGYPTAVSLPLVTLPPAFR